MKPIQILQHKLPSELLEQYDETALSSYLEEVEIKILNYCNIDVVPAKLYYTWANMTRDLITYDTNRKNGESGVITTIKEGDTSISFGSDGMRSRLDNLVLDYKADLIKYRKILW